MGLGHGKQGTRTDNGPEALLQPDPSRRGMPLERIAVLAQLGERRHALGIGTEKVAHASICVREAQTGIGTRDQGLQHAVTGIDLLFAVLHDHMAARGQNQLGKQSFLSEYPVEQLVQQALVYQAVFQAMLANLWLMCKAFR